MTDYPLAVATVPEWSQYEVTITQPDEAWVQSAFTAADGAQYYAWLEAADYTALPIAGVRFEVEVLSGSGAIFWQVTFDEDGTPDDGLGNRNFYSGDADYPVTAGQSYSWPLDLSTWVPYYLDPPTPAQMMERLAVTGLPDPSNVSWQLRQEAGTLTLRARLVAYTIDAIGGPPLIQWPRRDGKRTVKRLWPPPGNQQ